MENKTPTNTININPSVDVDKTTLEIRAGQALELKEPLSVRLIDCAINAPFCFLEQRISEIDLLQCHLIVSRETMSLTLMVDENSHYHDKIKGVLKPSHEFLKLKINSYEYITPLQMSELIKMNRTYFESLSEAMELVTQLRQFKAKIDKEVERNVDLNKGDRRLVIAQTVESNVPKTFKICIPMFVGMKKQTIEVETYFNPDDLTCTLISPEANDAMEAIKDSEIDKQIDAIQTIAPELLIIEQ